MDKPINHWIAPTVDTGARDYRVACGTQHIELAGRPPWKVSDQRWRKIRKHAPGQFKRVPDPLKTPTPAAAGGHPTAEGNENETAGQAPGAANTHDGQAAAPSMGMTRKKGGKS
jgi:hypothetical protein